MKAEPEEKAGGRADVQRPKKLAGLIVDHDRFRSVEGGNVDVAVRWVDREALRVGRAGRQYGKELGDVAVECEGRVSRREKGCQCGTDQCGNSHASCES